MKLEPLSEGTIREFLDLSRSSWYVLTLTDGKSLPFEVEGHYAMSKDVFFARPGYLKSAMRREQVVYVPLNRIAGLNTLLFDQKIVKTLAREGEAGYVNESAAEILFDCLLENANAMGFPVEHHVLYYSIGMMESRIEFTDVTFSDETALYSDWGYMQRISGGLNSIGVGVAIVTLSAGWSKSLWALFKKKVGEQTKAFDESCSEQEAVVNGFVTFIDEKKNGDGMYPKEGTGLQMEGANWVPAAISSRRPDSVDDLVQMSWRLIYFRDDGFMFPMKLWDRISQPIRVFSEVMPVNVKSPMGDQACYLKARAAAFLGGT